MSTWTDDTITRFAEESEEYILQKYPCLVTRVSIPITAGISNYTIPSYIWNIRRITWMGRKVWPYSANELIASGSHPNTYPQNRPYNYIYNDVGEKTIRFIPTPNISLNICNPYTADLLNGLVIEGYRSPDFTTNTERLPDDIRRWLIRYFVVEHCFSQEGPGMDLKIAKYFGDEFEKWCLELMPDYIKEIYSPVARQFQPNKLERPVVGRPVLPPQFGVVVDE